MKRLRREASEGSKKKYSLGLFVTKRAIMHCATFQQSSHTNGSIHTKNNSSYITEEFLIMYFRA